MWLKHPSCPSSGDESQWRKSLRFCCPAKSNSGLLICLVGGLEHDFYDFPYIGNVVIPTDELHHFSEGQVYHQPVCVVALCICGVPLGAFPQYNLSCVCAVQVVVQPCGLRMLVFSHAAGGIVEARGSERSTLPGLGQTIEKPQVTSWGSRSQNQLEGMCQAWCQKAQHNLEICMIHWFQFNIYTNMAQKHGAKKNCTCGRCVHCWKLRRVSQGFPVTCLNRLGAHDIPQFGLGDHMEVS